jgi:hypothetical protein
VKNEHHEKTFGSHQGTKMRRFWRAVKRSTLVNGWKDLASRTGVEPRLVGVAAVKEKGPIVIQRNLAAWIALYRT